MDASRFSGPASPDYTVEMDYRGEMLMYRETIRSADVICTFGRHPCILPRTLSDWFYPVDGHSEKMSAEEKAMILARIADYCRKHQGMTGLTFET